MKAISNKFANTLAASALILFPLATAQGGKYSIIVEEFQQETKMTWRHIDDYTFGGNSTVIPVSNAGDLGHLEGTVTTSTDSGDPGFVSLFANKDSVLDVSQCDGIEIEARSSTEYDGFSFFFAKKGSPNFRGHKASFEVGNVFQKVRISFSEFDDYWKRNNARDETFKCSETPIYCPSMVVLREVNRIAIMGEGPGDVDLEVKSIMAYDCTSSVRKNSLFDTLANKLRSQEGADGADGAETEKGGKKDEEGEFTQIVDKIAIPLSGVAMFFSLVALFSVCRANRREAGDQETDPKPKLESKSGVEIL